MDREKLKAELYDRAMMGDSTAALAYAVLDLQASHSVGRSERKPPLSLHSAVVKAEDMRRFLQNIRAGMDAPFSIETADLRKQFADEVGMAEYQVPPAVFTKVMKQVDPSISRTRPMTDKGRTWCYHFPQQSKHRDLI